jgi:hypothetical protein
MEGYSRVELEKSDLGEASPVSFLFQHGYLTVDKVVYDDESELDKYSFRVPNLEVADAVDRPLKEAIFKLMTHNRKDLSLRFQTALLKKDAAELESLIGSLFRDMGSRERTPSERFYHFLAHALFWGLNLDVRSETESYLGRSDLDLVLNGDIYVVIELKYEKGGIGDGQAKIDRLLDKAVDAALERIKDRDYGGHYQSRASEIMEMGLGVYHKGLVRVKFGR